MLFVCTIVVKKFVRMHRGKRQKTTKTKKTRKRWRKIKQADVNQSAPKKNILTKFEERKVKFVSLHLEAKKKR